MFTTTLHPNPLSTISRRRKSNASSHRTTHKHTAPKTLSEVLAHPTSAPANPTLLDIPRATITSTAHSSHQDTQHDPPLWQLHSTAVRFPEQQVDDIWMVPAQDVYETVYKGLRETVVETVWTLDDRCVVRSVGRRVNGGDGDVGGESTRMEWNWPIDPVFVGAGLLQKSEPKEQVKNTSFGDITMTDGAKEEDMDTPKISRRESDIERLVSEQGDKEAKEDFGSQTPDVHQGVVYDLLYPRQPTAQFTPAPEITFPHSVPSSPATTDGADHHLTLWERRKRRPDSMSDASALTDSVSVGGDSP